MFDDSDIINISFIPLMKSNQTKSEIIIKSIKLAQNVKDKHKRDMCIVALFALSPKYLSEAKIDKFMEVFEIVDIYAILDKEFEEKYEKSIEKEKKKQLKNFY